MKRYVVYNMTEPFSDSQSISTSQNYCYCNSLFLEPSKIIIFEGFKNKRETIDNSEDFT